MNSQRAIHSKLVVCFTTLTHTRTRTHKVKLPVPTRTFELMYVSVHVHVHVGMLSVVVRGCCGNHVKGHLALIGGYSQHLWGAINQSGQFVSQKKRGYAKSEQEKRRIVWGGRCFCRLDITPPVYCNTKFFIVAVLTLKTMTGYFESTYGQSPDHVPEAVIGCCWCPTSFSIMCPLAWASAQTAHFYSFHCEAWETWSHANMLHVSLNLENSVSSLIWPCLLLIGAFQVFRWMRGALFFNSVSLFPCFIF